MNDIQYNNRLVAFVDILGFSQIIKNSTDEDLKYIKFLNNNITHVLMILHGEYKDSFSIKMFSDCICISCNSSSSEFELLIQGLSYIQFFFATRGIFIRGGLTQGLHFENENMIFSKGLVKAYELEKIAVYPRIIIDNEIVDLFKIAKKDDRKFLMKAPDGVYFVDYLDYIKTFTIHAIESITFMGQHKFSIEKQVKDNLNNNNVLDKYKWTTEYHNLKFIELFSEIDYGKVEFERIKREIFINATRLFPRFEK